MNNKIKKRLWKGLAVAVVCSQLGSLGILGEDKLFAGQAGTEKVSENKTNSEISESSIASFANEYFSTRMEENNVPGAAIAVVKDGKEIFKKGYGYSNLESQAEVDPDITTFPACSVSKLFTATAIMKLYEQGDLDLNEDILKYADDIKINNTYDSPITCGNLLTHSSGLDEQSELNGSTLDKNMIQSQQFFFEKHIPNVIKEPDTLCRYSNMGYNLLGYIVEKTAKVSYEEYVKEEILKPLGMNNSSVRIDDDNMAAGYKYENGSYSKCGFAYQYTSGSSGIITTVADMEKFMIMHLNSGRNNDNIILSADTEELMQKRHFGNNDIFAGMAYGFIRSDRNGVNVIKHEGALPGYTTTLMLLPDSDLGIYVATNGYCGMIFDFEDAFLDHFYGSEENATGNLVDDQAGNATDDQMWKVVDDQAGNVAETENGKVTDMELELNSDDYKGIYRSYDGISEKSIMKLGILFDDSLDLKISKSSRIIKNASNSSAQSNYLQLNEYSESMKKEETGLYPEGENVFLREDGNGHITFTREKNGKVVYAFNDTSHKTFEKISILEERGFLLALIAGIIFVFILSSFIIMIKCIRKKTKNKALYFILMASQMLYMGGSIGTYIITVSMIVTYDYSWIGVLKLCLSCIIFAIIGTIYCIGHTVGCIIKAGFGKYDYIVVPSLITIQIIFIFILNYFNMIGYKIY